MGFFKMAINWRYVGTGVVVAGLAAGLYFGLRNTNTESNALEGGDISAGDERQITYGNDHGGSVTFTLSPEAYTAVQEYFVVRDLAGDRVTHNADIAAVLVTMDRDGDRRITTEEVADHLAVQRQTLRDKTPL